MISSGQYWLALNNWSSEIGIVKARRFRSEKDARVRQIEDCSNQMQDLVLDRISASPAQPAWERKLAFAGNILVQIFYLVDADTT